MRNLSKSSWIKIASTAGVILIGFLIMFSLGSTEKHSKHRDVPPEVRLVETESVNFGDIVVEIEGNGVIQSQRTLNFVSEATGVVLFAKNDLKDGTFVGEGETILGVDSREVENTLFTLRSGFMNAIAAVLPEIKIEDTESYDKWYNYFITLDIHKPTPELPEISVSQEKIKLSGREIFSKYYAVKNQEILLSKYRIVAPFSGYLKSQGIIKGSFVAKGQQLFYLSDAKNVEIVVPLLVDEVNLINFSKAPTVKIYSDKIEEDILYGKIYRKETALNRNSQTLNVYVTFSNNNLNPYFLPGNYVSLKINGKKFYDVAQIPRYVIDNEQYVFTMEDGKLAKQKVDVITIQGDVAIIKHTVSENMKLVTTILQRPLIGMGIRSSNETLKLNEELPDIEEESKLSYSE
ncbi:MAG: efflux RND transporter periplasmic adaptor subunit [Ignavibacteriaceae bacterium]